MILKHSRAARALTVAFWWGIPGLFVALFLSSPNDQGWNDFISFVWFWPWFLCVIYAAIAYVFGEEDIEWSDEDEDDDTRP